MIRTALAAALFLAATAARAQDAELPPVRYPALAPHADAAQGFVPAGWTLEQQQSGDLNGDGRADLALAFHQADSKNVIANEGGMCGDTIDTNPRILAVVLAVPGGGFKLAAENHSLVPRYDSPCADDWFAADSTGGGGITIERGALQVRLSHFMSAGGWSMGSSTFTFRWQQGALRLIGFDYVNAQRNTGAMDTLSINYLTRRVKTAHGTTNSDKEKISWSTLPAAPPPTIEQVGNGMEFDPNGLVSNL
ncbi:MAG: hypothetical protein V4574_12250 [Pseudomonadota bacterium]